MILNAYLISKHIKTVFCAKGGSATPVERECVEAGLGEGLARDDDPDEVVYVDAGELTNVECAEVRPGDGDTLRGIILLRPREGFGECSVATVING